MNILEHEQDRLQLLKDKAKGLIDMEPGPVNEILENDEPASDVVNTFVESPPVPAPLIF